MHSVTNFYEHLSYQGKLKGILNLVFLTVSLAIIVVGIAFARLISGEIYDRNQEKLSILSMNVESKLTDIENVTTEFHQNGTLQSELIDLNKDDLTSLDEIDARSKVQGELTWILADKTDVSQMILLNRAHQRVSGSIFDSKNFFDKYSLAEVLHKVAPSSRRGYWFFNKHLSQALFVQNLYSTRSGSMTRIGTIMLFVNTSFIQDFLEDSQIFSKQDFFVIEQNKQFYSTNLTGYDSYIRFIKQNKPGIIDNNSYEIERIKTNRYYIYSRPVTIGNTSFRFYYFLLNQQVIQRVIQIEVIFFLIMSVLLFLAFRLANRYLTKLIDPINKLANDMKKFQGEADLEKLRVIEAPTASMMRSDEIGVLYQSFHDLIHEIENQIIKDYHSKILTQEMEYRFLQAQLDPHFLYNTLNSINWLAIARGDTEISEMVTSLALLFRKKAESQNDFSTVASELEIVDAYVKIQSIRFKSRLRFVKEVSPETLNLQIPTLIIQPLVENTIKYAVEQVDRTINVCLQVYIEDRDIVIEIIDNGPGFEKTKKVGKKSSGIGIKNIRSRIELLYDHQGSLTVLSKADIETKVILRFPRQLL